MAKKNLRKTKVPASRDTPNALTAQTIERSLAGIDVSEPLSWDEAKQQILSGK